MQRNDPTPPKDEFYKRPVTELLKVPRSAQGSLRMTHKIRSPRDLMSTAFLIWIADYFKTALTRRHKFLAYNPADERAGIYKMPADCTVTLAADWGSGTPSAYRVRERMKARQPDITIHLGDVYYSGKKDEFAEYFLGRDDWPRGSLVQSGDITALPAYALNANHEMYSGGHGYYDAIINHFGQEASYFCLENDHWRVVGLDSGYYSKILPLLELLPFWISLPRPNQQWLHDVVLKPGDTRPVILLSHHQWFSAFEGDYTRLGKNVGRDPNILLWIWGHEHRLAGYGSHRFHEDGPMVRARCIGHGGMPIEGINKQPRPEKNLVFYDHRPAEVIDEIEIGFCGFASLRFEGPSLVVSYEDEHGVVLVEEKWLIGPDGPAGEVLFAHDELELAQSIEALVS